ncbi:MAG: phosphotransferase [Anaerolineaceae bacterium]|nr:phosphotransferase [Anaerolineaceae bacterium]
MEPRIRESYNDAVLQEAMRRYGIVQDEIQLLDGFESFIYEYQHGLDKRILRISHSLHRDAAAIRGEVDWLRHLAENGVSVAYAVPSLSGELVEVLGEGAEYFCASAYIFAPGQPPRREDWDNGLMIDLGQLLGRMNALAKTYQPRDPRASRPHLLQDIEGFERFLPPGEEAVAEKWLRLVASLHELPTGREVYGIVHQDAHGGNFFIQDGKITLFDFDDTLYGWYAYDVAMAFFYILPHDCSGPENLAFARKAFAQLMEGYSRENSLSPAWLREIPRFLKLREIDLYIAIHRSFDINNLDPWCASYMKNRREKILADVPFVDMEFF